MCRAASNPGVIELVELLRAMGRTKEPAAADYLESEVRFPCSRSMTVAAAESILRTRGGFGDKVFPRVRGLLGMGSSIYVATCWPDRDGASCAPPIRVSGGSSCG